MIVSKLTLYDFRKFHGNPGLSVSFHKGLNALIGENDSGKTAIIDALKLVLLAQGNENIRPVDSDFYQATDNTVASEFKIECVLSDFTDHEAKNFIEYLSIVRNDNRVHYFLHLHYRAWKEGSHRIFHELRAGDVDDGITMDSKARELLKVVYLKPLRDAEREMRSGRNSRISQILLSHPVFKDKENHNLINIFSKANDDIRDYFTNDSYGKVILQTIRDNLASFNDQDQPSNAELKPSELQLKAILESLSLIAAEIHPGLGEQNLLFIAAELLLLKDDTDGGLKLALVEELEAHLHPQAQLRLISFLQNEYNNNDVQIIISTHSPILASKINLKNIILLKNNLAFELAEGKTGLQKSDYLFLQRFLDSTKANLFFAKGVIMVEGDAESILIPVIADILGYSLEKYGVSIVNVGSTAFLRYSRILIRCDNSTMGIPVSVITDCDVNPHHKSTETIKERSEKRVKEKTAWYETGSIHAFVSPRWTLEYCIAMSCLRDDFHKSIHYGKKILNARGNISLTDEKINEANLDMENESKRWENLKEEEKAYNIYELMLNNNGKSALKSIVAQCLAATLRWKVSKITDGDSQSKMFDSDLYGWQFDDSKRLYLKNALEADRFLKYIVDAIKYATGVQ